MLLLFFSAFQYALHSIAIAERLWLYANKLAVIFRSFVHTVIAAICLVGVRRVPADGAAQRTKDLICRKTMYQISLFSRWIWALLCIFSWPKSSDMHNVVVWWLVGDGLHAIALMINFVLSFSMFSGKTCMSITEPDLNGIVEQSIRHMTYAFSGNIVWRFENDKAAHLRPYMKWQTNRIIDWIYGKRLVQACRRQRNSKKIEDGKVRMAFHSHVDNKHHQQYGDQL